MRRLSVYIDGFNLYHAITDLGKPHLKWVDLWSLSESLCRQGERLTNVYYFSAYATWLPGPYARHRTFVAALESRGVTALMGTFKEKDRTCRRCGARWPSHEEKETDVHIAAKLVSDAFLDLFDRAAVVSADSDLRPALKIVRANFPSKEVLVVAPPGRFPSARDLRPRLEITKGRLAKHLLPETVTDSNGQSIARRPTEYAPPGNVP